MNNNHLADYLIGAANHAAGCTLKNVSFEVDPEKKPLYFVAHEAYFLHAAGVSFSIVYGDRMEVVGDWVNVIFVGDTDCACEANQIFMRCANFHEGMNSHAEGAAKEKFLDKLLQIRYRNK